MCPSSSWHRGLSALQFWKPKHLQPNTFLQTSNTAQAGQFQLSLFCKLFSFMATWRGRKSTGRKDRWFCYGPDGMWTSISVLSSSSQNHLGWHLSELALNRLWISQNMKFSAESLISIRIKALTGYTRLHQFLNPMTGFILKWIRNLTPLNNTSQP